MTDDGSVGLVAGTTKQHEITMGNRLALTASAQFCVQFSARDWNGVLILNHSGVRFVDKKGLDNGIKFTVERFKLGEI